MTNEELIAEARRLENDYGDNYEVMTHMSALADALETAEARVKELEAQVKDLKCEQVFRISEMQELVEAQARIAELESKLAARQLSENDREVLAKQLRDIGAVRKVDQDCSCQDCEGAAEWVNAPLSVVLDHFKTNVSDAEPTHLVCAWCPQPARGDAWHNDGKLHPSCGQIDHGQGWVPPYTPRAAVPDAATEEALNHIRVTAKANARWRRLAGKTIRELRAERDAAIAAIERVRAEASAYAKQPDVMEPCGAVAQSILLALDGAHESEEKP